MKPVLVCLRNVFLVLSLGCSLVWAQATAQISGTVKDQSGAVLPGVEITATHDRAVSKDLTYNLRGNVTLVKNEIIYAAICGLMAVTGV